MSREKQIEEMATIIARNVYGIDEPDVDYLPSARKAAEESFDVGYRKQKYGKWEKRVFIIFDSEKVGYRCSECNTTWDTPTHYCPNCGAKMKGGTE